MKEEEINNDVMNILTTYSERLGTEIEDPQLKEAVEKFAEDYLFKSFDGLEASGESIVSQMTRLEKYNLINTKNYKELKEALKLFKEKKENYEKSLEVRSFIHRILEINPKAVFVSFDDFGTLFDTDGIRRSRDYEGFLTDEQIEYFIDLQERINRIDEDILKSLNKVSCKAEKNGKPFSADLIQLREIYILSSYGRYEKTIVTNKLWKNALYPININNWKTVTEEDEEYGIVDVDFILSSELFTQRHLLFHTDSENYNNRASNNYQYSFDRVKNNEILIVEDGLKKILFQTFQNGIIIHGIFGEE